MTREDVLELFTHMEWADAATWSAVNATGPALGDRTVMERLHHIHVVQHIYLRMWLGSPEPGREVTDFADLAEVQRWARAYYAALATYMGDIDPETLSSPVAFPWAGELVEWFGEARPATVQETMIQVVMHTAHHRGQLCTRIRELGGEPPLVDFVAWLWMGRPEPAWHAVATP
jgi:uncharacterized damage-inducible protein DinB